jgi:hypothetical protein
MRFDLMDKSCQHTMKSVRSGVQGAVGAKRPKKPRSSGVNCKAVSQTVLLGVGAGVMGVTVGVGLPVLFGKIEQRDKG